MNDIIKETISSFTFFFSLIEGRKILLRNTRGRLQSAYTAFQPCRPSLSCLLSLSQGTKSPSCAVPSSHSPRDEPGAGRGACKPPHSSLPEGGGGCSQPRRSWDLSVVTAPHPWTPWGHHRPTRAPRLGCDLAGALANHIWNVFQLPEQ